MPTNRYARFATRAIGETPISHSVLRQCCACGGLRPTVPSMSHDDVLEQVRIAANDDAITVIAPFQPKGSLAVGSVAAVGGAAAGGAAGGQWGRAIGAGLGASAGREAAGVGKDRASTMFVGVSPTEVYLLGLVGPGLKITSDRLKPLAKIDREHLAVETHHRLLVHQLVLEDTQSGHRIELEADKLNTYHAKALIELLAIGEEHHHEVGPTQSS